ncbi:MAG TPA: type II secretion system F family protein [bacterium]|nr:type II secretion system F family protein [bacterium]HNS33713.1 type II secretion system F family protein [bacterium]HNZ73372.1 type II secretion system F family protein [bacterium]HOH67243.1 type II secretion system F family protein [bacterium]HPN81184.1 type II secretion system F family protein [bacterium]
MRLSKLNVGEEKDYFIENLAMLLAAGMDILLALAAIKKGLRSRYMRAAIDQMSDEIDSGTSISNALAGTNLMPAHVISLIDIGEASGRLAENLQVIVEQQQKERSFNSKIRSAMMYPVLVLGLTAVIGVGVAWFILPRLSSVFSQLSLDLPVITRILISVGDFVKAYGQIVLPVAIGLAGIILYLLFFYRRTKFIGQAILFNLPAIKKLIQQIEVAQLGYILGTLLDAGLPIIEALVSLNEATTFFAYRKFFAFAKEKIEEGNSFQRTFELYKNSDKIIPLPVQQMIASGEQSGRLPEILLKIGEIYEEKTETTTKNLSVILEPLLLVIIWLGVVAVALAVILPIYSLIGGLNKQNNVSAPTPQSISETPAATVFKSPMGPALATTTNAVASTSQGVVPLATSSVALTPSEDNLQRLKILNTGVGYLNVRSSPTSAGKLVGQVVPGQVFDYLSEQNGWYQISLESGQTGWVTGAYIEIISD